jgi:hypothetical protein
MCNILMQLGGRLQPDLCLFSDALCGLLRSLPTILLRRHAPTPASAAA